MTTQEWTAGDGVGLSHSQLGNRIHDVELQADMLREQAAKLRAHREFQERQAQRAYELHPEPEPEPELERLEKAETFGLGLALADALRVIADVVEGYVEAAPRDRGYSQLCMVEASHFLYVEIRPGGWDRDLATAHLSGVPIPAPGALDAVRLRFSLGDYGEEDARKRRDGDESQAAPRATQ